MTSHCRVRHSDTVNEGKLCSPHSHAFNDGRCQCAAYQSQADYGPTLTKYHLQFSRHPRHLFQTSVQFVQQINVKMIHLVCSDGIRTHTRLTRALDQDLRTSQNDSNGREHSSLGEVSLSGLPLVLQVWIPLLHQLQITTYFLFWSNSVLLNWRPAVQ